MGTDGAALDRIMALPCWEGPVPAEPLKGGLSNESWKVTDGAGAWVVRFGVDFPWHHVSRMHEAMVARAAAEAGFGPRVLWSGPGVLVTQFLGARTWTEADMRAAPDRIGAILARFHRQMPAHVSGAPQIFWVFHTHRDYARTLAGTRLPPGVDLARLMEVNAALEAAQAPMPIIFGHNDLLPGNFLDDGERLWLIDFEYAGFGTAMFDIAGAAGNAGMAPDGEDRLLLSYFGAEPGPDLRRSFAAMTCAALLREALWALVSARHMAAPGADYGAHATDYLGRLSSALDLYQSRYGKLT